ncbi:MAG TPA: hypothetical protein VGN97_02535 [Mesorhizobium sp.]|jgi:hypothetical protein|nr:hypothetical protein [Mesorhizobium sp.]
MARRFFMNMRSRSRFVPDQEGDELQDGQMLREHAIATARDLIRHTRLASVRDWLDWTYEITDDTGHTVLVLPFEEAAEGMGGRRAER